VTDLIARLSAPIAGAAASLADGVSPEVGLERPADATHGDFATSVALRLAPVLRRAPRQIAEDIAARIRDGRDYAAVEVAGAGFVNLRLSPTWFHDAVAEIAAAGDRYGEGRPAERRNVLVELVSANPTGEVTVASARNGAYGDSVGRLVEFGASVRARRRGDEIPEGGYPGEIVKVLAGEIDLDPDAPVEAWTAASVPRMFDRIKAALARLRISVDIWFSEAELHASGAVTRAIAKARAAGHVYEQGGATWLATSQFGDDKDRVLIKSDGSPAYFAADLAYIEHKFERGHDRLIYILGADHHGYVARLKAAAACMGYDPNAVEVPIYQMVTVSGERMGKRRGNAITADELMDAIGIDATRFFLVQRSHDQTMDIDLDLAVRQERENPVYYVQYAHARAQSILRRAAEDGDGPTAGPWSHAPEAQERDLVKRLVEWPDVVRDAADRRAPHRIVAYVHQLAGDFHVFHHDLRVLHDDPDTRAFRLTLTAAVGATVRRALDVIGVEAPDTM
jgi:arginyl-tRNA synthetase